MPIDISNLRYILESFRYLNFSDVLSSLNTPIIYITLAVGGFFIFFAYASFRRHLFHTSLSGAGIGFLVGILLTLGIEGALAYKFIGLNTLSRLAGQISPKQIAKQPPGSQAILGESSTSIQKYLSSLSKEQAIDLKVTLCQEVLKELK